jgi:hypothetical protein
LQELDLPPNVSLPMKRFTRGFARFICLAALCFSHAHAQEKIPTARAVPADVSPDDMAKFLAGMQPLQSSYLANLTSTAEWQHYAADMNSKWGRFDAGRLQKVRAWRAAELGASSGTVFYPFSGPDFVFVHNFFPHAGTYILCGLEPVGDLPGICKVRWRHC